MTMFTKKSTHINYNDYETFISNVKTGIVLLCESLWSCYTNQDSGTERTFRSLLTLKVIRLYPTSENHIQLTLQVQI